MQCLSQTAQAPDTLQNLVMWSSLPLTFSSFTSSTIKYPQTNLKTRRTVCCSVVNDPMYSDCSWQHKYDKEEILSNRIKELKNEVREGLLMDRVGSLPKLELIDKLQKLGIGYHFEKEIKKTLESLWFNEGTFVGSDLHSTALRFRLLRQHGYQVSQDVFSGVMDEGHFHPWLSDDIKGLLSLYEASYLCLEGEHIMSEANAFTSNHLQLFQGNSDSTNLVEEVNHALELPLHWRMPRLEGKWYIDVGQRDQKIKPSLLELAKLDFNLVQSLHQEELGDISRWWKPFDFEKSVSFSRNWLVESYIWSVGVAYEPHYGRCREWLTKIISLVVLIDDIYDMHGKLDDLELFTTAVERWDNEAVEQLPDYMKICYLALYKTVNDMAYTIHKEKNQDILPYLKRVWKDFCKAMLLEAKWSNKGYTPSLEEYLANAWMSSSTPVGLVHAFFATNHQITDDLLECLYNNNELLHSSSLIFRLCNDLATSSAEQERGDVPSAIQCYMRENNTSEKIAREHIKVLISEVWKKLNKSIFVSPFTRSFVNTVMNHVRTAHSIYQYGGEEGVQDHVQRKCIKGLFTEKMTIF